MTPDQNVAFKLNERERKKEAKRLAIEDGEPPQKQSRRKGKHLILHDVGIKGKAQKVINKLELKDKDASKQTKLKDAFAKGAKPKTIALQDAPLATEKAPKLENVFSEEGFHPKSGATRYCFIENIAFCLKY